MTAYTLAEHSGLGALALEAYTVQSIGEQRQIRKAGGVTIESYSRATALETAMLRYAGDAICPSGVAGSFSAVTFRGMRLWIPDEWAQTVIRLADECDWNVPFDELGSLASGILTAPTT